MRRKIELTLSVCATAGTCYGPVGSTRIDARRWQLFADAAFETHRHDAPTATLKPLTDAVIVAAPDYGMIG